MHSTAALEGLGVNVINCLNTGIFAGNKLFTHMLLKKHGVPTPYASVSFSKDAAMDTLEKQGYPKIIKPTVGSWGRMVSKINDSDSAEGIISALTNDNVIGQVINLGSGKSIQIKEIVELISKIMNKTVKIKFDESRVRPYDVKNLVCDYSKAKNLLNWSPKVSLEEGLEITLKWARENNLKFKLPFKSWSKIPIR